MNNTQLYQDLSNQSTWIVAQFGYKSVDHIFACDMDLFMRLAVQWRQAHAVI